MPWAVCNVGCVQHAPAGGGTHQHAPRQAAQPGAQHPTAAPEQSRAATRQFGTVRPRSTSTSTRLPSILRPSAILYACFISFLCSYSMKAYPRGLPARKVGGEGERLVADRTVPRGLPA